MFRLPAAICLLFVAWAPKVVSGSDVGVLADVTATRNLVIEEDSPNNLEEAGAVSPNNLEEAGAVYQNEEHSNSYDFDDNSLGYCDLDKEQVLAIQTLMDSDAKDLHDFFNFYVDWGKVYEYPIKEIRGFLELVRKYLNPNANPRDRDILNTMTIKTIEGRDELLSPVCLEQIDRAITASNIIWFALMGVGSISTLEELSTGSPANGTRKLVDAEAVLSGVDFSVGSINDVTILPLFLDIMETDGNVFNKFVEIILLWSAVLDVKTVMDKDFVSRVSRVGSWKEAAATSKSFTAKYAAFAVTEGIDLIDPFFSFQVDALFDAIYSDVVGTCSFFPPTPAPSSAPSPGVVGLDQFVPNIAVTDTTPAVLEATWEAFRKVYPLRPFCVLQVRGGSSDFILPRDMLYDDNLIYKLGDRDQGNANIQSDWYDLCELYRFNTAGRRLSLGLVNTVAINIVVPPEDVRASYQYFMSRTDNAGLAVKEVSTGPDGDWIQPFIRPFLHEFPSATPSMAPSSSPSMAPSGVPSATPSSSPSVAPSGVPSVTPSQAPSQAPSQRPSPKDVVPSATPSSSPSVAPSGVPSVTPSQTPSANPSQAPSQRPSPKDVVPSATPSSSPSVAPSGVPSVTPSQTPSANPSQAPSETPSQRPSPTDMMAQFATGNTFPAINGQTSNLFLQSGDRSTPNIVCGSVQAVLAHPTNADICFAGAANGGVWRTTSCSADMPQWTPLTDGQDTLSTGDMVFDELDATGNTVLVGIGARSSFFDVGGKGIGLLYTQTALDPSPTWTLLSNAGGTRNFQTNEIRFNSVFAKGDLMLAGAYNANSFACRNLGIFRSMDRGATWTNVLRGVARAIASDPNDSSRFYATVDLSGACSAGALPNNGVFTSSDSGATWSFTSTVPNTEIPEGSLSNAKLRVSADRSRVWSVLVNVGVVDSISYSDDQGANWIKMDTVATKDDPKENNNGLNPRGPKPGTQGETHLSLLVSRTNRDEMYVGGDRQPNGVSGSIGQQSPNSIGATDYTGRLFRGDASVMPGGPNAVPSPQWEHMTDSNMIATIPGGGTTSSSGPHADSRDMEFRADGSILESDDGGVFIRTNPSDNTGDWYAVCGNMQVFEIHNMAYEPILGSVLFGNQDTGTIAGMLGLSGTYKSLSTGDGGDVMIDYKSSDDFLVYYYGFPRFEPPFGLLRMRYNKIDGQPVGRETDLSRNFPIDGSAASFVPVAEMNPSNQMQFVVAIESSASGKYFAFTNDRGNTFTTIFTLFPTSEITAMKWSADGMLFYAVDDERRVIVCRKPNLVCERTGRLPQGTLVKQLAVHSTDSNVLFAAVSPPDISSIQRDYRNPRAFMSMDGGASWSDISVPGSILARASLGAAVVYMVDRVAFGTSNGVLVPNGGLGADWQLLAPGLPKVIITEMVYEAMDDTLVVATLGRGVWFLKEASLAPESGGAFSQQPDELGQKITINFVATRPEVNGTNLLRVPGDAPADYGNFTAIAPSY